MTREELIDHCKYFHGIEFGDSCPYVSGSAECWFWETEGTYVYADTAQLKNYVDFCKQYKVKEYKDIPYELIAVMFVKWSKYVIDIEKNISLFYKIIEEYRR